MDEALIDSDKSRWQRLGDALGRAALATGRGTAWLAKAGYKNRNYVPAMINAAIGDQLAHNDSSLAISMSLRSDGHDVRASEIDPIRGHVAVFVHGLMADESYWTRPFGDGEGLGPMLAREHQLTPLYVRYNSGRHISENGRTLAALLEDLVQSHTGIDRLTLCGHSMGGLVVRSAAHDSHAPGHRWPGVVDSVVLLGAPNDGAYLEQVAHASSKIVDAIPGLTADVIARLIDGRSDGIKDLRLGLLVDADWKRDNADNMCLAERTHVPSMPNVRYCVAIGTVTESPNSIVAAYFGDGMVGGKSALTDGNGHSDGTEVRTRVFTKTAHLALVSSPEVQRFVSDALAFGS